MPRCGRHRADTERPATKRVGLPLLALAVLVVACGVDLGSTTDALSLVPQDVASEAVVLTDGAMPVPVPARPAPRGNEVSFVPIQTGVLAEALESGDFTTAAYIAHGLYGDRLPPDIAAAHAFENGWRNAATVTDLILDTIRPAPLDAPPIPADSGEGERIVYSRTQQRIWIISESDRLIDSYLISGRLNEPRLGTYRVYSKSPKATAFYDGITMNWMVRFAHGSKNGIPIGFHDLPLYANGQPMMTQEQFGTPLSGGCVRQPDEKAKWLYDWADLGTVVVVLP